MDALYTRVEANMKERFPFDEKRAIILTARITKILGDNVNAKWDKMSGELFTAFIDVAMEDIAREEPQLFL